MCQLHFGALIEKITLTMQHRSIFLTSFIVVFVSMRTSAKYAVVIDGKSQAEAFIPKHKECVSKVGLFTIQFSNEKIYWWELMWADRKFDVVSLI